MHNGHLSILTLMLIQATSGGGRNFFGLYETPRPLAGLLINGKEYRRQNTRMQKRGKKERKI